MFTPPDPAIMLANTLLVEIAQDLVKASALPYVLIFSNIVQK